MEKTKKPFLIAIAGIVALSMLAVMPAPALADTFNVPGNYQTIQEAINAAADGDTVLVAPGTYNESIVMKLGVTVKGSDADETIIDGSGKAYAVLGASYSTISGFTITGSYYGIYNDGNALPTMTITNNIITGNSYYGIYNPSNFSPTITNNIIIANDYSGIYNASYSSPMITNNIISGNKWYGIHSLGSSPQIENNNVVDNAFGSYLNCSPGAGEISVDPMFVDPGNGDYHLQEGSPCIDSGTNDVLGLPETDAEGKPRIVDGDGNGVETVDMGAFEYQVEVAKADEANMPMDCFKVSYVKVIDRTRYGAKRDKIEIRGSFKLADGVTFSPEDDVTVTMTINDKEITVPAGSLKEKHFLWLHYHSFRGDIDGVRVHMHLDFNRCRWWVKIYGMEASDLVQSEPATVNVSLTIGKNVGEDSFELIKRWKGRRMGFARFIEWSPNRCCGRWWWWR